MSYKCFGSFNKPVSSSHSCDSDLVLHLETKNAMHHSAVKRNLVNRGPDTPKNRFGGNDPVCPKPRRVGSGVPELLKPLKCSSHSHANPDGRNGSQANPDGRNGILNMITEKTTDGRESVCIGCSPTCFAGSPPSRTDNPLVHDVQFIHQMELYSPFTRTKLSDKFGFSTSASPV